MKNLFDGSLGVTKFRSVYKVEFSVSCGVFVSVSIIMTLFLLVVGFYGEPLVAAAMDQRWSQLSCGICQCGRKGPATDV